MKLGLVLVSLVLSVSAWATSSNSAYIHDLEGLLNSVESRDSSRPQLTLKLADAYFNEAVTLSGQPSLSSADQHKLTAARKHAVQLYRDSLSGLSGVFPVPTGAVKGKIQFQLARLYGDLGESKTSEDLFRTLANNDGLPDIQRESLLRLAEILENRSSKADLKQAEVYYRKALSLCSGQDVCSYCHYRLAWVENRQDKLADAIKEIQQSLWDSKGQVREEALRDMIGFLGSVADDGKDSLTTIEKLSAKLNRPQLLQQLADSYFAHGNRQGGVYVLNAVNRKAPTLKGYVRLMEEDYGFRNWEKFDADMDGAIDLKAKGQTAEGPETEKILRRLTVQLDGERISRPAAADQFKKAVLFYLTMFPNNDQRVHMIDGWLAAETDDNAKIQHLKTWIAEEGDFQRPSEVLRLRKIRAALAQKVKNYDVVIEEMGALKTATKTAAEKRETIYQIAYADYQKKNYDQALPLFQQLAAIPSGSYTPDKWAVQSEQLALDILAQHKDYAAILKQARQYTHDARFATWIKTTKTESADLADVKKIEDSAEFQWATSLGEKPEALAVFKRDCEAGLFADKACANAKVLAVKIGDQASLIEILKKEGNKDQLAAELEASAQFTQAAQMLEPKLKDKATTTRDYLKVALLYELGSSNVNRDRILHQLQARLATQKSLGEEEGLILTTFKDADLMTTALLKLPWKKENREYLTDYFVSLNQGGAGLAVELAKQCHDTGPGWEKVAIQELRKLDEKQSKIHFAGNGSKRKFQIRVAALKALTDKGDCYLKASTAKERVIFATLLSRSETALADEIKSAPIPAGVDEAGKAQLEKALAELAQPFIDKGQEFAKLADEQLAKVEDPTERANLKSQIDAKDDSLFTAQTSPRQAIQAAKVAGGDILKQAIEELHHNPNQRSSLEQLKNYYESAGNPRLAAYFQGRLLQLGGEVKQ